MKWRLAMGIVSLFVCAAPASALSLKSLMGSMAETTKAAKDTMGNFDPARAADAMQRYIDDARASAALTGKGGSAKAKDLHDRFLQMAATSEAAKSGAKDRAGFRSAFTGIVGECRSCHAVYK